MAWPQSGIAFLRYTLYAVSHTSGYMTTDALIMLSGAFVAFLPFLGFPRAWDAVLFFLTGIFIVALGIVVRRQQGRKPLMKEKTLESFEESAPPQMPHSEDK